MNVTDASLKPAYRRLRGYAYDPSFSNQLDAFGINVVVYSIRWEDLEAGPIGEYIEVIDIDPASGVMYPPVYLDDPKLLAQDGLPPSESNPQFHQQMVYAVAMLTIQHFEKALGRPVQWSSTEFDTSRRQPEQFVKQLRIYPHAFRDANAYYSSQKKAVLFGYFSARPRDASLLMPGSLVFSCLSHDIITHEVTHALIDGIYKRYVMPVHEDTLALHEAFSDIVALFQHFTFPEILQSQISRTKGNLSGQQWLSQLAQQFGQAIGQYKALRDAIGRTKDGKPEQPDPNELAKTKEPHHRGSILVAAIFDAFLNIYNRRTADLYRIATEGRGILPDGEIHPDLVRRLADEAARTAKQFLSLCIRALDYCPPVGTTFGELLRAMITADVDLVPNDPLGFRVALIESFKRRGIYPIDIRTLSVENLSYTSYNEQDLADLNEAHPDSAKAIQRLLDMMRDYYNDTTVEITNREKLFQLSIDYKKKVHGLINRFDHYTKQVFQDLTGMLLLDDRSLYDNFCRDSKEAINYALADQISDNTLQIAVDRIYLDTLEDEQGNVIANGKPSFEVHSLNRAQRVGPDYNVLNQVILTVMQRCQVKLTDEQVYEYRGGCTLVIDIDQKTVRFIHKGILRRFRNVITASRLASELLRRYNMDVTEGESPFAPATWPDNPALAEPFALLHR